MREKDSKLGLLGLISIIVTSMIGGGIFSIPSDMAQNSGVAAVMIGWIITGASMICLSLVFQSLSLKKPELEGGIYSYARAGFGRLAGFSSAWGYWVSAFIGNVAYTLMLFEALSYFFPIFKEPLYVCIGATVLMCSLYILISTGIKEAAIVNTIVMIAKLIPLGFFIIVVLFFFNLNNINLDFWGKTIPNSLFEQVKKTMLITVWVFIGVEGAVVISSRAKHRKDIGNATVMGLLFTMFLYIVVTFITLAALPREVVITLPNPSLAYALELLIGKFGAIVMNIGLVISTLGALLGWTILATEIPYIAAQDDVMPKIFSRENKNKSPIFSLLLTVGSTYLFIILSITFSETYQSVYLVASAAIVLPYFLSALFYIKVMLEDKISATGVFISSTACIYSIWLIYAALDYLFLCAILYSIGFILFIAERKRNNKKIFTPLEWFSASAIFLIACVKIVLVLLGKHQLGN